MARTIPLTRGHEAIVDDHWYEPLVSMGRWFAQVRSNGCVYASRMIDGRRTYMHRVVMGAPDGIDVDHKDRDGKNNQENNLRLADRSNNLGNSVKSKNNKSGYKGVYWSKQHGKWRAQISVDYRHIHLGLFSDVADAAKAYDLAAIEVFGEFARLNFPNERKT